MRVLHLTHHAGCIAEIGALARRLGFDVVHERYDDGYNIGPERAQRSWMTHGDRWSAFEWVITSDTAPLARIFLQNRYSGRLIVWVCNRFDYADQATNDCGFPDPAFYDEFRRAAGSPKVTFVSYTEFEHHYARSKGVELGRVTIAPTGLGRPPRAASLIPASVDRANAFFVPAYHNDTVLLDLAAQCRTLGIQVHTGRYAGPDDVRGFQGLIHIPYAWSNFALFENLQAGLVYFVPSMSFLLELAKSRDFFWSPPFVRRRAFLRTPSFDAKTLTLSEWFSPEHAGLFVYFDSWADLARRVRETDVEAIRRRIATFAATHAETMIGRWREVFERLGLRRP